MKIRTSLVLACFVLSVVPLAVIVIYSYFTSRGALESAYQAEGTRLTAQMDRRLGTIREELQQRLAEVSALPNMSEPNVLMTMGDIAPLVESLEIHPAVPPAQKDQRARAADGQPIAHARRAQRSAGTDQRNPVGVQRVDAGGAKTIQ